MSELDNASVGVKIVGYSVVGIGLAVLFSLVIVLGYIVSGLVLSILWGWFVVPIFPLVPEISIAEAIGITLIVHLFMRSLATKADTDEESETSTKLGKMLARSFVAPFITLFIGWIVLQFL